MGSGLDSPDKLLNGEGFCTIHNNFSLRARPTPSRTAAFNLFVCNYRFLLDPLYVSAAFSRADLATATYSISHLSEILAPIRTFRLTRDRAAMQAHLSRRPGELVAMSTAPSSALFPSPQWDAPSHRRLVEQHLASLPHGLPRLARR
ncbi:hypothetical protein E2562_021010 [Oryza meyeriana var. granulata]|uniref:Uncharacterized protein n=1 Tax=Oryza meyeriana var. granulata TaxID=110450 RepID=A0A6G1FAP3_9ORYZ|nr:hypothetical protein E2562_021010 [Oryza meyeriana var. granulata]